MRVHLTLAVILGLMLAAPANAQSAGGSEERIFGTTNCSQRIACPGMGSPTSPDELATAANDCVVRGFGSAAPSGGFFATAYLDADNCMQGAVEQQAGSKAKPIVPRCCVVTAPNNSCSLRCQLIQ